MVSRRKQVYLCPATPTFCDSFDRRGENHCRCFGVEGAPLRFATYTLVATIRKSGPTRFRRDFGLQVLDW